MTITLTVQNQQAIMEALAQYGRRAEEAISRAVNETALEVRADIVRRIQRGPKTGRVYRSGNVTHRASAPGEAPATDTGRLANSIVYERIGLIAAKVSSRLPYATYLEFGTQRIAPRPAWTPAVERATPVLQRRVLDYLGRLE
jgi:hypothetical protein